MTNLLNNAAKYTPPGGEIHVLLGLRGSEVTLTVRDTGIGIEPALLQHIFDLFIQGERSSDRSQGGLGLGLALVRNLAHRHGGAVRATSGGPGCGSQFRVTLPHVHAAPQGAARDAVAARGEPVSIMIVDDNADAARTLALYLQELGHEVEVAFDGGQALALAGRYAPRVLLLDIGLPDMDGYTLARRLHALPNTSACLTVALTGYGLPEDRERSRRAGFHHHLTKPVSVGELTQLLEAAGAQAA
ncbi:response regulator [Massilia sp. PAMC28688]|uniref:response regulator n=1 Tax=Massilia sp. PAMC28688 TaxID=2861283 RepID=UPI001E3B96BA|nr:response regulator [Massilia sp. PAMC28688]